MNPFTVPLAYKYVAIIVMLLDINRHVDSLNLNESHPIRQGDLKMVYLSRPLISGFGGVLETTNYAYGFSTGRLRYVTKLKAPDDARSIRQINEELAGFHSRIDTNGAYKLAKSWLEALSANVEALEHENICEVKQRVFYPNASGVASPAADMKRVELLPIFDVVWSNSKRRVVIVTVSGVTQELLQLRLEDDYLSELPSEPMRNIRELVSIPDDEFLKYSHTQRSNLVWRYAVFRDGIFKEVDNFPDTIQSPLTNR